MLRFGDEEVFVEIADEPAEQIKGLMGRRSLGADDGMLFVFGRPTTTGFWMKNTLIPLSIAFMRARSDGRFEVLKILDMEPCREADDADCPTYAPGLSYDVALEVNRGWFADAGVEAGDEGELEAGDEGVSSARSGAGT